MRRHHRIQRWRSVRRGAALIVLAVAGAVMFGLRSTAVPVPGPLSAPARPAVVEVSSTLPVDVSSSTSLDGVEPGVPDEVQRCWYDGRLIRSARTIEMRVTGYSPDARSCAPFADGMTASGYSVWTNGMKLAAADTRVLPFGTLISIPGYDDERVVPVLDRGGRIKGNRLDLLFPTHREARKWGVQYLTVTVWEDDE